MEICKEANYLGARPSCIVASLSVFLVHWQMIDLCCAGQGRINTTKYVRTAIFKPTVQLRPAHL